MKNNLNKMIDSVVDVVIQSTENVNITTSERVISAATGSFMVWKGVKGTFSKPSNAVWELILGSALLYRGITGYCSVKNRIDSLQDKEKSETYIIEAM